MAELNLKQITDKLNAEFESDTRKLIFWYDEQAAFADDIETLELKDAKVYRLERNNQFYTKYFLECVDKSTNYLIYAPFAKPPVSENHLHDTLLYSKQFFTDKPSLLIIALGIDEKYKPILQKYIKFFGSTDRTQKFYDLKVEVYTKDSIEIAIMSVICKTRIASFDEVLRSVIMNEDFDNNKFLTEFEEYDLLASFWRLCEDQFGYIDLKPTIEKLVITMFVTYTERYIHGEIPKAWQSFVSYKSGNIIVFMDNLMNNVRYKEGFNEISGLIASDLEVAAVFREYPAEAFLDCDNFAVFDELILKWILERLLNEDIGAKLRDLDIPAVCRLRINKHFGESVRGRLNMLTSSFHIIGKAKYTCPDDFEGIVKQYQSSDFKIDGYYREFYYEFDRLSDSSPYEKLKDLVENIYVNEYLAKLLPKWNAAFTSDAAIKTITSQRKFYDIYVKSSNDKVAVIISDALRYETGHALFQILQDDIKCKPKLNAMLSLLPSVTSLGMAALLPHRKLELTDDYRVLADGFACDDIRQRETILRNLVPKSRCVRFDDIKSMKKAELREIFTGMEAVYVYHNQIDARGDKLNTENEVFTACLEAISEIYDLIKRLSNSANTYHFIITADHGFIYTRDKLSESDKICGVSVKGAFVNRRFILSENAFCEDGVAFSTMGWILRNDDARFVSYPVGSSVFKAVGSGQNYVHGGSSPQEMIVPVIDVKVEKGHMETRPAQIILVSLVQKITNLIVTLEFMQTEPISDEVRATKYRIFFITENNEKISNECVYIADKKDNEAGKRMFRLKFDLKNKQYEKTKKYCLVAYDEKNDLEVLRHDVQLDIAFSNDFGFRV